MNELILKVEYPDGHDHIEIAFDVVNGCITSSSGCRAEPIYYPEFSFRDRFISELTKHGLKNYFELSIGLEALMSPTSSPGTIDSLFKGYLDRIDISNELTIIDPYFYCSLNSKRNFNLTDYVKRIEGILVNYEKSLQLLNVVTLPTFCPKAKSAIEKTIKSLNSKITITHETSPSIHDRFWIAGNRNKGILSGASFNGFGKSYCVVDFLEEQDVKDIVAEFENSSLIPPNNNPQPVPANWSFSVGA